MKIICAGNIESFSFATPIGIGLVESAMNLSRLCLFDKPDSLLFIGSAGSYGKHKVFDIVHSKSASQIELSFINRKSYTPIDNLISSENVSHETSIVNSSNYITTDKSSWDFFDQKNIHLENMEFYSVMRVAQEFSIPCGGVFVVTNNCDENAHFDFVNNHKKSIQLLTQYITQKLLS